MRVVAMVSGGKDSCYNMMQCVAEGHEIVALANIHPKDKDELDSYMYQTVGHMGIEKLAEAMGVPLFRMQTEGLSTQTGKNYVPTDDDEVEDLFNLLKSTKDALAVEAVAVGAIFSDYQRVRVENVCVRLGLVALSYLWRRDQTELLQEMIDCQVYAIIIKVASLGLVPDRHLGKSLREIQPHLLKMKDKYGLNVCGEGGEYETFTLNCPLFKKQIVVDDMQTVISSSDPVCPIGYINFTKLRLIAKDPSVQPNAIPVKTSIDYLSDLNESSYNDLSDPDLSETELEQIEMENRLRESMTKEEIISHSRSNSISLHAAANSPTVRVQCHLSPDTATSVLRNPQFNPTHEQQPIHNQPNVVKNTKGWMWISGIQGVGDTGPDGMEIALGQIVEIVAEHQYHLQSICYVTLYVRNMSEYAALNEVYSKYFNFTNPPTRVCVECPLPSNLHVIIEAVAYQPASGIDHHRHTMHVQGISHWAPANIGPYSQSTRVGEITYVSGQIALVPGSMNLIEGGIKPQCQLALRHISRIAKAMNAQGQLRDVVQGICFVTHPNYISEARRQWERRTANAIVDYIVLPALPRQAAVEWQVWAHTHNDKFDYEETGCSVDQYNVFSRRRWNYESNCAAIVCYVSTGLATSTTQLTELSDEIIERHCRLGQSLTGEQIDKILTYTLNRVLKGQSTTKSQPTVTSSDQPPPLPLQPPSTNNNHATDSNNSNNNSIIPATHTITTSTTMTTNSAAVLPAIHFKIFYQVNAAPSIDMLIRSIDDFREKVAPTARFAYTVLPASSLQNFSTFISVCGIKHE